VFVHIYLNSPDCKYENDDDGTCLLSFLSYSWCKDNGFILNVVWNDSFFYSGFAEIVFSPGGGAALNWTKGFPYYIFVCVIPKGKTCKFAAINKRENNKDVMTIEERIHSYEILASDSQRTINRLKKRIYTHGIFRLVLFVGCFFVIYAFAQHLYLLLASVLVIAIVFALSLKRHNKLSEQKESAELLSLIAENELKGFLHDFSAFDGAPEKIDPHHPFSFDLDLFGEKSVFQQVNRTVLPLGKEMLADIFQSPLTSKDCIEERQEAVKELAKKEEFCLLFRVAGLKASRDDREEGNFPPVLYGRDGADLRDDKKSIGHLFWKLAVWIVPFSYLVFVILWLVGIVPGNLFFHLYFLTLVLSLIPIKKARSIGLLFDKKSKTLNAYAGLLKLLEQEKPEAPSLKSLRKKLACKAKRASDVVEELAHYTRSLDVGFTLAMLILNPVFLWTTRYALKIENWMKTYGGDIKTWFSVLAEMDALISLGTFAINHPDYAYPEIADSYCFRGEGLGHPLISREKCVKNDIDISRKPFFMIITGANMAGKSTYLRTIGVNHLLASVGLPACANKMRFYPGRLLTNLRTSDSLVNSESYFFAELKRLKMIIDRLEAGEAGIFIILDEILKGTNSEDKQKGSLALMKRLVRLGGNGIIATHDLALGNLEDEFPQEIGNWHFDARIQEDTLTFTYRLQEGIAQNMNASFLMRKMGITE
jgi:hypothetical protein